MEIPYEMIQKIDAANLIAMASMLFFMYCRIESKAEKRGKDLDKKFEAIDKKFDAVDKKFDAVDKKFDAMDKRFDKIDERFDKLEEKVTDIDRRLCRMEGAFSSKDCCMLKEERHHKKVV